MRSKLEQNHSIFLLPLSQILFTHRQEFINYYTLALMEHFHHSIAVSSMGIAINPILWTPRTVAT